MTEKLQLLSELYCEITAQIARFQACTNIFCLTGCGECCLRFEPYISVLEAFLVVEDFHRRGQLDILYRFRPDKQEILCPFYDPYTPFHCTIHPIRPLICRLFAFAAKQNGARIEYSPCLLIELHDPKAVALARRLVPGTITIPVYPQAYQRLCAIDFALATDLHPLTDSLAIALRHRADIEAGCYPPAPAAIGGQSPSSKLISQTSSLADLVREQLTAGEHCHACEGRNP